MKRLRSTLPVLLLAAGLTAFAGCASTPQRESTGEYVDDAGTTAKVKAAIVQETGMKSMSINVETYRGVVQLSGFVDTEGDIRKAGEIASRTTGVKSVINNLVIKPTDK
ncbi:BON domain-containing protein [Geobacter sp. DSM 9736]|uniref:BON domain-containing protein n=1 Tax=Geobacter sp. DSM 9736 TaxID=1277350 RepID=UPI000B4FDA6D|nr:BON domain-containing protein [Geobacter sp. DSM 9736]SNB46165.1 BON domain-containing protein [Geobacter sp. DSM 9736]